MFDGQPIKISKDAQYTPTWQLGREQPTPDDYGNFQRNGYRGSSLIYSCVREKATSYAGLPFAVVTPAGDLLDSALVLELLENPSSTMDGDEFRTTLLTHLECAGNVYIVKERQSTEFPERRSWPVKELSFLRPDYVEIKPGATRQDDMFVVKIDGRIVAQYPRADIIHIKEPDPCNDFYGLSKIAVIMREGDLDQRMTDFERSFFMNAGVPVGILLTKTPLSQAEKRETKSRFRRMFSGVGKWFDLLILNADEGKYQQLGTPPTDMEADKTRDHVESRVCAVFGVPPVLVGVNVGLKQSTYSNYEQALRAFWTETMIPEAKFVAGALTRELYAEFRTTGERGNKLTHDFNTVEALQTDNSAKLTAAANLIREIGSMVPVNEILALAGLPNVESGDVVIPKAAPAASGQPPDAIPAKWRLVTGTDAPGDTIWIDGGAAMQSSLKSFRQRHIEQRMPIIDNASAAIADFLAGLRRRVIAGLGKSAKAVRIEEVIGPEEEAALVALVRPYVEEAMRSGWTLASLELNLETAFNIDDPWLRRLLDDAGERIQDITQTTRVAVSRALQEATAQGLSLQETAALLGDLFEFSPARAMMIARTEISSAQNRAATARWRESGLVQEVTIFDGDSDAECAAANGQTWTLDEFDANPSEHPNCIRTATPVRIELD